MTDDSLASAYPSKRSELAFASGRFSPDGTLFAVVLKDIKTGDPEQVWLYDMRSKRLVAVTEEPPQEPETYMAIRDLAWADDGTLYISAARIHVVAHPFFVAARMNDVKQIDSLPDQISMTFKNQASDPYKWPSGRRRQERNDRYVVTLTNQGHGDLVLRARPTRGGAFLEIARAGWELESFLFAGDRSEVLYPTVEAIKAFDLQTGKSRFVFRGTGGDLRILDQTSDGRLIAYTVFGPCVGRPDYSVPVRQPRHVCFVQPE